MLDRLSSQGIQFTSPKNTMISEASVKQFYHLPKRDFEFAKYYDNGIKMWKASCMFEVRVELDPKLIAVEMGNIEYRQYVRGGVWVRRGNEEWTADDKPNGNKFYPIPPYAGESKATGLPREAVTGTGLSLRWKEDGQIEKTKVERYGHRDTATLEEEFEADIWKPQNTSGGSYILRDTPSISGPWGYGLPVTVWIELWFEGFVVEVERTDDDKTRPIRVLKRRSWKCFWQDKRLE